MDDLLGLVMVILFGPGCFFYSAACAVGTSMVPKHQRIWLILGALIFLGVGIYMVIEAVKILK